MGKKSTNLGRAIIKDRFVNRRIRVQDSSLHTTDLDDGYDWNRFNIKSVTEENTLDEFLSIAQLAGTEFIAEKSNVSIVTNPSLLQSPAEQLDVQQLQDAHRRQLKIPRRPTWDSSTTPEQLDLMEREAFLEWRRNLSKLQEVDGLVLTPYERNLDFWRQLWRVIERSDVIVQIVDARNPLLFRCEDLEAYVHEVDSDKINVILLNKADYLTRDQRVMWASYFDRIGVRVAFWSATAENERLKHQPSESDEKEEDSAERGSSSDEMSAGDDDTEDDASRCQDDDDSDSWETVDEECSSSSSDGESDHRDVSLKNLTWKKQEVQQKSPLKKKSKTKKIGTKVPKQKVSSIECKGAAKLPFVNSSEVLTGCELIDLLRSLPVTSTVSEDYTTIGLVGYPNVGKSSTINALLRAKRVPVSATPGRTKHFQTLFLDPSLMLCDCPGLVMPSFVSTKASMVVSGILPVDQMQDFVPPVSLVCQHISRDVLEATYGILLPFPSENEDPSRCPTAYELLGAYARVRGFMTHKGIPDYQRAARCILKDYINGKLLHCIAPPGVDQSVYEPRQICVKPMKACTSVPSVDPKSGKYSANLQSSQRSDADKAFFAQVVSQARSCGIGGVVGFTRTSGYSRQHVSNIGQSSSTGADEAAAAAGGGKPSKRHNNSKKREKTRRITSYLDA